jgi:predicted metal-binding protein
MTDDLGELHEDVSLRDDLERYRRRAIELGATDAKIIPTGQVLLDERAQAKCQVPTCRGWGTNANCPPYVMSVDALRKSLKKYQYAVFFKVDVTTGSFSDFNVANQQTVTDITWRIESEAFYDGHHFAMGFAGTGCKGIFCPNIECSALKGDGCRYPWKARPAMHGAGFHVYGMAKSVGWKLYTVGPSTDPTSIPHMSSLGIIFVD